jgi:hypothetical protein
MPPGVTFFRTLPKRLALSIIAAHIIIIIIIIPTTVTHKTV